MSGWDFDGGDATSLLFRRSFGRLICIMGVSVPHRGVGYRVAFVAAGDFDGKLNQRAWAEFVEVWEGTGSDDVGYI